MLLRRSLGSAFRVVIGVAAVLMFTRCERFTDVTGSPEYQWLAHKTIVLERSAYVKLDSKPRAALSAAIGTRMLLFADGGMLPTHVSFSTEESRREAVQDYNVVEEVPAGTAVQVARLVRQSYLRTEYGVWAIGEWEAASGEHRTAIVNFLLPVESEDFKRPALGRPGYWSFAASAGSKE